MVKKLRRIVLFLLIAGFGVGVWLYWTSDTRRIRALIDRLPALVSKKADAAPHDGILRYGEVDRIFTEPFLVRAAYRKLHLQKELTRSEGRTLLSLVHRHVKSLEIRTTSPEIRVDGTKAEFTFDAEVVGSWQGESGSQVVHVTGVAERIEGRWFLRSVCAEPLVEL